MEWPLYVFFSPLSIAKKLDSIERLYIPSQGIAIQKQSQEREGEGFFTKTRNWGWISLQQNCVTEAFTQRRTYFFLTDSVEEEKQQTGG